MDRAKKIQNISVVANEIILYELDSKISQESIILSVKIIKNKLEAYKVEKEKIHNICEISIEMLQNILKYSYGKKKCDDKKNEADGVFIVKYNTEDNIVTIISTNLIDKKQEDIINQRIQEVSKLDEKAMNKIFIGKMRSKKDNHKNGAGLGFITMAQKIINPIETKFEYILGDILRYTLKVVV